MDAYEKERAFCAKQRYLTDIIVPLMLERGDGEALYLVKEELQKWQPGMDYVNGNTITWNDEPITCIVSHNTCKHPDWTPDERPEYWHRWKRGKQNEETV